MGKIVVFLCDFCNKEYKDPNQVFIVDGIIYNGSEERIFKDNKEKLICKECLLGNSCNFESDDIVEENEEELPEYLTLQAIYDEKSELEFINYLGHVTKESFNDIYNKSLIGCYYPTEELTNMKMSDLCKQEIMVIYKVLAGVPQIKKMNCYVSNNKKLAFIKPEMILKDE